MKENIKKGTLYGTAASLLVGTVLTGLFDLGTEPSETHEEPLYSGSVSSSWRLPEWMPEIEVVMPTVGSMPTEEARPLPDDAILFGLMGMWR